MTISLLLVDDHAVVRQGLRMLLAARDDIEIVGEADDGHEAVRLAAALRPSVILMDLHPADTHRHRSDQPDRRARPALCCAYANITGTTTPDSGGDSRWSDWLRAQQDELDDLTAREREMLRAIALDRSTPQIATDLCIGEATVRSHTANLLNKLNLRDRTHATVFALKRGLVSLDEVD